MKDGHGGVGIGSEVSGGIRNIYAINCTMDSKNLDRLLRIKTSSSRGGVIENVFMKDIKAGSFKDAALSFDMYYDVPGNFMPTIRNIWVEDVNVETGGNYGVFVRAYPESPVQNLQINNCNFKGVKTAIKADHVKNVVFHNFVINDEKMEIPQNQ